MEQFRLGNHLVAEIAGELTGSLQVNLPADQIAQVGLNSGDAEQGRRPVRQEFHQHIHIAVGAEIIPQNASEERQARDTVAPTELGDRVVREIDTVELHDCGS